jgi:hypothetical protein
MTSGITERGKRGCEFVILAHNLLRVRARTVARSDSENHRPTPDFDPGVVEASDGQT